MTTTTKASELDAEMLRCVVLSEDSPKPRSQRAGWLLCRAHDVTEKGFEQMKASLLRLGARGLVFRSGSSPAGDWFHPTAKGRAEAFKNELLGDRFGLEPPRNLLDEPAPPPPPAPPEPKAGDRVRLRAEFVRQMLSNSWTKGHGEEFGSAVGVVEGRVKGPTGEEWPELNVRWDVHDLRYAYPPDRLELVDARPFEKGDRVRVSAKRLEAILETVGDPKTPDRRRLRRLAVLYKGGNGTVLSRPSPPSSFVPVAWVCPTTGESTPVNFRPYNLEHASPPGWVPRFRTRSCSSLARVYGSNLRRPPSSLRMDR